MKFLSAFIKTLILSGMILLLLGWGSRTSVVGEVTLTMEVSRPGQKVVATLGPYNGRKVERTIIASPERFNRVLEGALIDTMQAMSSDPNLINELSQKPKN